MEQVLFCCGSKKIWKQRFFASLWLCGARDFVKILTLKLILRVLKTLAHFLLFFFVDISEWSMFAVAATFCLIKSSLCRASLQSFVFTFRQSIRSVRLFGQHFINLSTCICPENTREVSLTAVQTNLEQQMTDQMTQKWTNALWCHFVYKSVRLCCEKRRDTLETRTANILFIQFLRNLLIRHQHNTKQSAIICSMFTFLWKIAPRKFNSFRYANEIQVSLSC